jgi:hypothetical protein
MTSTIGALQAALAAEQAASFGYTVVGAHLAAEKPRATADWIAHQKATDALEQALLARHTQPSPAPVSYTLPHQVHTAAQARALAIYLEQRVTAAYLQLVATNEPQLRKFAATQMRASTLRAITWGAPPAAFPGLPPSALQTPHT